MSAPNGQPNGHVSGAPAVTPPFQGLQSMSTELLDLRQPSAMKVALPDIRALALVVALIVAATGVVAVISLRFLDTRRDIARLEAEIARAGDVEKKLAEIESQIAAAQVDLAGLETRTPQGLRPEALGDRIEFKAKALGLDLAGGGRWTPAPATVAIGPATLRRHDRSIEVRGPFKAALALVAEIESWPELVAVQRFESKRPPKLAGERGGAAAAVAEAAARAAGPIVRLDLAAFETLRVEDRP
jgi:hypothetical protein